jgi:hypothetical protein
MAVSATAASDEAVKRCAMLEEEARAAKTYVSKENISPVEYCISIHI